MKTVTKYVCEATGKAFDTETEAAEHERFEGRVREEVRKREGSREPLTLSEFRALVGKAPGDSTILPAFGHFPIAATGMDDGRFVLTCGYAALSPSEMYRRTEKVVGGYYVTAPVLLRVAPSDPHPVAVTDVWVRTTDGREEVVLEVASLR
jgi:hypothetical protein